ncbi:hypothetical protein [Celeribacter naphthalenivorans]|uniref:hypothetical protein n=1 Tax=Celeribacter naphthalenivorans TaxID=1614694 RepID=UPI001CFA1B7E|nr:hypothetical protein [Celeribacter naphthalenivorans]
MKLNDTLNMLMYAFGVDQVQALETGEMSYHFGGDQPFGALAFPGNILRLHVPLSLKAADTAALTRVLEGNCLGIESGTGQLALSPESDGLAMVDFIALDALEKDDVQMRIVDLLLYADYWETMGAGLLGQQSASTFAPEDALMTTIRV